MRYLKSEEIHQISGGFVTLDMSGDNIIVSMTEQNEMFILSMNNQNNHFYFQRGADGMVTCNYYIQGQTHTIDQRFNLFKGQYGFFGMNKALFVY